jgi:hypothetical protein
LGNQAIILREVVCKNQEVEKKSCRMWLKLYILKDPYQKIKKKEGKKIKTNFYSKRILCRSRRNRFKYKYYFSMWSSVSTENGRNDQFGQKLPKL